MLEKKERDREKCRDEAEEVKEILSVVSTEVPTLIKNMVAAVFSEEAGRNMGKAAAAFYKELKDSEIPHEIALKMTEDYVKTFRGFGDLLKQCGKSGSTPRVIIKKGSESEKEE